MGDTPVRLRRLWHLLRQRRFDAELKEEMEFHRAMKQLELEHAGVPPDDARRESRRALGNATLAREDARAVWIWRWLDDLARDIVYAARTLRRSVGFTATATATLALAIAATTTMFSVVDAVLLRPLPFRSPQQLVMLWIGGAGQNLQSRLGYSTVEEWRRQTATVDQIAVLDPLAVTLAGGDGAERISVARVSPNFFPMLGVTPVEGRAFTDAEAGERRRVALISHRFWQTHFAGSKDAINSSVILDGLASTIVGILPAGFDVPFAADIYEPHTIFPDWEVRRNARGAGSWFAVARLRSGVSADQAQAEMTALARSGDQALPAIDRNQSVTVEPLTDYVVGSRSRAALWLLMGAVVCVLLIGAANVASLSLARSIARAREMAIRTAIGAGRARIVRQLLTETVTLAVISGLVGTGLTVLGIRAIRAVGPVDVPRLQEVSLDPRALGWMLVVSLVAGILVGLGPVLTMWRRFSGVAARRIRRALVAGEFALAIVLLTAAGLLVRSWQLVTRVDPGFRPERVLSMNLSTTSFAAPAQRILFYDAVLAQTASLPGVERAAIISELRIGDSAPRLVTAEGSTGPASERLPLRMHEASEGIFAALGTPLLRGRFFSGDDRSTGSPVAIINETMARRLWRGPDAVGRRFKLGPADSENTWFTVVGVVGDMRRQGMEIEPIPQMFEPLAQNPSRLAILLVRTSTEDPLTAAASIQAAVRGIDKQVPIYGVTTLESRLGADLAQRRFQTALLAGFAAVGLAMAAVGIYGLILYSATTRTREIGIRLAVGAQRGDILRMMIREGLQLSAIGLAVGLAGATVVARAGAALLFGVTSTDPVTLGGVSVLLTLIALTASYLPARRAARIDPIRALRCE
jgi:putative ABC transport system permease protein